MSPVLSPRSTSGLTGTYRSTFSSAGLDRPSYYGSGSIYSPRVSSYSERYTTRSYADGDGRRIYSRSASITEDGITTRYREESREGSVSTSRDSGISSIQENSVLDLPSRRDSSVSRNSDLSSLGVTDTLAEFRNKYSPANYVPACQRRNPDYMSRSKSINDIGLPPIERSDSKTLKKKATYPISTTNPLKLDNQEEERDANGNRASVAEIRRKFDNTTTDKPSKTTLSVNGLTIEGNKPISENRFKKHDSAVRRATTLKGDRPILNGDVNLLNGRQPEGVEVNGDGRGLGGAQEAVEMGRNHTSNFASYIWSGDYKSKEGDGGKDVEENGVVVEQDISPSPRISRNALPGTSSNCSSLNSLSATSASVLRDRNRDDEYSSCMSSATTATSSPFVGIRQMGLNGLKNIGNTCFMNSVIQCLSNTKPLLEYVKRESYSGDINTTVSGTKGALIIAFAQVLKELWSDDSVDRAINTVTLKSQIQRFAPRFMGYAQQDAQEFLRYLLEGLHEEVNRVTEKPKPILTEIDEKLSDAEKASEAWQRYLRTENSKIVDLFVGQLKSTLRCTHCGHCSVTFDPFWDLSLPIPQRTGQLRLSQCLEYFTKEEVMDGDEKPTCSKCKERRKCTKSFSIQKFPRILVIHLKRFSPTERFRGKLSVAVDFPLEGLDMRGYAADSVADCRYSLYAISNHSGTTYSGHYTAYCRHPYSGAWHEYNDTRVSSISSKSLVSGEAYVLFYELDSQKSHL